MDLSIFYLNDVHGYLEPHAELFYRDGKEIIERAGGYASISTKIMELKNQHRNTLLFDGGDTFHGTLPLIQSKGEAIIPILKKLNFDAMVGHWDFAYGPDQLKKIESQLSYSVLGINVYNEDGSLFLKPFIIKQVEDIKVAVIGICSNIIDKTMPKQFSQGLKVTNGVKELPIIIEQVKDEGADIIILLSHNGFPQDMETLKEVTGIDICLSAHTHNRLYEAVKVNDTIVIQCGCHGAFMGHLQMNIEHKLIKNFNYHLVKMDETIQPDAEIETLVADIMNPYHHLKEEVAGHTNVILHRYNTLTSTMDDLLLAAISLAAGVDIAFSNGWRYGAPINVGQITKWDLYNIIPMNPVISTTELSGQGIIEMLEENLELTFSGDPMKQMGGYVKRGMGLNIKLRIENPKGNRIQEIYFQGKHLPRDQIFKVAFVTSQGVPEKWGTNRKDLKIKAVEAMEQYLKQIGNFITTGSSTFNLV